MQIKKYFFLDFLKTILTTVAAITFCRYQGGYQSDKKNRAPKSPKNMDDIL